MTEVINEETRLAGDGGFGRDAAETAPAATPTGDEHGNEDEGNDDDRVKTLKSMGFSRNKALRALHYTNDGTVEQAVEWISTNDGTDPECSDAPFVKPPKLTPEEAKAKAEELIRQARIKREKEEKAMEKLREAERIRSGKEMAAIARLEEEQRLKRMVELREREKQEEKAARDKIRKKLEQVRIRRPWLSLWVSSMFVADCVPIPFTPQSPAHSRCMFPSLSLFLSVCRIVWSGGRGPGCRSTRAPVPTPWHPSPSSGTWSSNPARRETRCVDSSCR